MYRPRGSFRTLLAAILLLAAVPGRPAAGGPEASAITVLDEACVERRAQMCLRLADRDRTTAIESSWEDLCSALTCGRGWYRTDLRRFGRLGPLCVCERRRIVLEDGERCAEGFMQTPVPGADGTSRTGCELPDLRMDRFPGEWYWPSTPWDLMTCLQFARFGPGSAFCRTTVSPKRD